MSAFGLVQGGKQEHGEGTVTNEFHDEGAGRGEPTDEVPRQEPGPEPVSLNPEEIEVPKADEGEGAD